MEIYGRDSAGRSYILHIYGPNYNTWNYTPIIIC